MDVLRVKVCLVSMLVIPFSASFASTDPVCIADTIAKNHFSCMKLGSDTDRLECLQRVVPSTCYPTIDETGDKSQKEVLADMERDSDERSIEETVADEKEKTLVASQEKNRRSLKLLESDDPNYFNIVGPINDDLDDDTHAEFYVSIKYPLYDRTLQNGWDKGRWGPIASEGDFSADLWHFIRPDRVYVHYNGLYDFYISNLNDFEHKLYDSSPVVSKRQNPGLSIEYDWAKTAGEWTTRIGWFHESNGQQDEPAEDGDSGDLDKFFARRELSEEYALSQVSRSWNYYLLRQDWSSLSKKERRSYGKAWLETNDLEYYFVSAELRHYDVDDGDDIWWDDSVDHEIGDFDGARFTAEFSTPFYWDSFSFTPRLDIKTGINRFFDKTSYKVSVPVLIKRLPGSEDAWRVRFSAFYWNGYGKDPSTYHLRTEYWGLGLELR